MSGAPLREVPRPLASPQTPAQAFEFYVNAHNLAVTPVRQKAKAGYRTGWSKPEHHVERANCSLADNIGVLNGTEPTPGYFFHDIDIDANSDAARRVVERLLPPTGWRYGRASKPRSHANCLVAGRALQTSLYRDHEKRMAVELRGLTRALTHSLSVAPGSTHASGEAIRFCEPRGEIGRVEEPEALESAVRHAAVGIVLCE